MSSLFPHFTRTVFVYVFVYRKPQLRGYDVILIDEAQDLTPGENKLLYSFKIVFRIGKYKVKVELSISSHYFNVNIVLKIVFYILWQF